MQPIGRMRSEQLRQRARDFARQMVPLAVGDAESRQESIYLLMQMASTLLLETSSLALADEAHPSERAPVLDHLHAAQEALDTLEGMIVQQKAA